MSELTQPLAAAMQRAVIRDGETPTDHFTWGTITWMDNAELTGSEALTFGVVQINAGQSNPRHYHPNCDEILYITEGELLHGLGEEEHHLHAGDMIHIPQNLPHQARNPGQTTCRMIVVYNTGRREMVRVETNVSD